MPQGAKQDFISPDQDVNTSNSQRVSLPRKAKPKYNLEEDPKEILTYFSLVSQKKSIKNSPVKTALSIRKHSPENKEKPKIQPKVTSWLSKDSVFKEEKTVKRKNGNHSFSDNNKSKDISKIVKATKKIKVTSPNCKGKDKSLCCSNGSPKSPKKRKRNIKLTFESNLKCIIEADEQEKRIKLLEAELLGLEASEMKSIIETKEADFQSHEETNELTIPGINVFDCNRYLCYLSNVEDILNTEKATLEEINMNRKVEVNSTNITDLIIHRYFIKSDCYLKLSFMDLLFKFMLAYQDELVSKKSQLTLKEMIIKKRRTSVCWFPSVRLIASLLLNLGVVMNETCPVPGLFRWERCYLSRYKTSPTKNRVETRSCHQCDNPKNHLGVVSCAKLCMMIETLLLVCETNFKTYKGRELSELIIIFYWVALDSKIINHPVIHKVKALCGVLLENITKEDWEANMIFITSELFARIHEHQNIVYMIKNLPNSQRGRALQTKVSFRALHCVMKLKPPPYTVEVQPRNILAILMCFKDMEDLSSIHSFISLVGMCFSNMDSDISKCYKQELERIEKHLKKVYSRLDDYCIQATTVKNLIVKVRYEVLLKTEVKNPCEQDYFLDLLKEESMEDCSYSE